MTDTYTGNLDVGSTPELNLVMTNVRFSLEGVGIVHFLENKVKRDNQILTDEFVFDAGDLNVQAKNEGDETIIVRGIVKIDGIEVFNRTATLSPGETTSYSAWTSWGPHEDWVTLNAHNIAWELYLGTEVDVTTLYDSGYVNYTIGCYCTGWVNAECTGIGTRRQTQTCTPPGCDAEERIISDPSCRPFGDITRVTLDGKLLPEGGTLDWIVNDDAHVKIFFKNTGAISGRFHIWLTEEVGVTVEGCDITTGVIPADGVEYYVDLCVFLPDEVKIKTLTAHIEYEET